jgi:hypothetical protein
MERQMTKVIMTGGALRTPKALPVTTRVRCVRCDRWYEIEKETLLLDGFTCDCGTLRMPPRFRKVVE